MRLASKPPPLPPPARHSILCFFCPLPLPSHACSKIVSFGIRLFLGVSLLTLAVILPINLSGGQVRRQGWSLLQPAYC